MFLVFGMITVFMLTVLAYTYINFAKQSEAVQLNLHTYNVIKEADELKISLLSMETGARGFAVTGKEEFLEPFNQGNIDYQNHLKNIKVLTADKPQYQERLSELNTSFETWLQWETTQVIDVRRKITLGEMTMDDLIAIGQTKIGKDQMDNSRKILNTIIN